MAAVAAALLNDGSAARPAVAHPADMVTIPSTAAGNKPLFASENMPHPPNEVYSCEAAIVPPMLDERSESCPRLGLMTTNGR
jgi:hypothetical protein